MNKHNLWKFHWCFQRLRPQLQDKHSSEWQEQIMKNQLSNSKQEAERWTGAKLWTLEAQPSDILPPAGMWHLLKGHHWLVTTVQTTDQAYRQHFSLQKPQLGIREPLELFSVCVFEHLSFWMVPSWSWHYNLKTQWRDETLNKDLTEEMDRGMKLQGLSKSF